MTLLAPAPPAHLAATATLRRIADRAAALDAAPRFPTESFADLRAAGLLTPAMARGPAVLAVDVEVVRAVAGSDASTARVLDGHLNGLERLALHEPELLRGLGTEGALLGVWGADPAPDEGSPARIVDGALWGEKVFCSGAGGVTHALVQARDGTGAKRLACIDARRDLCIDRDWYHASGLRASESHRVTFEGAPVLAVLGGPDELASQPFFARDAVRTAATWAGLADAIVSSTVDRLRDSDDESQLAQLGSMRVWRGTIDRWLEYATGQLSSALGGGTASAADVALAARIAIAEAARTIADQAARTCGSRELIRGGTLDRARRDLDLFLLQHRLEGKLAGLGRGAINGAAP